jgi:hypothetical protein
MHCAGTAYSTEEFLGPTFKAEASDGIQLQQEGALPCFHLEVTVLKVAVARVNLDLFHMWTDNTCRKVMGSIPDEIIEFFN